MPSVSQVSLWQTSHRHRRAGEESHIVIKMHWPVIRMYWPVIKMHRLVIQYSPLLWSMLSTNTQRVRTRIEVCITDIDLEWGLVGIVDMFLLQLTQWKWRGVNMIPKRSTATVVDHLDGQMLSTVFKKYQEGENWSVGLMAFKARKEGKKAGEKEVLVASEPSKEPPRLASFPSPPSSAFLHSLTLISLYYLPLLHPLFLSCISFPSFPSAFCAQFQTSRGTHCLRQDSQWGSFKSILPPLFSLFALSSKNGSKASSFEFLVT